jgi:hypothetical protein
MERRDVVTSDALMRVFVQTAEPVWGMVGKWLRDGMGLGLCVGSGGNFGLADELDDEFFIESSGVGVGMMALGLLDLEFWNEGYALRECVALMGDSVSGSGKATPLFLEHVAELVLSTGKAVMPLPFASEQSSPIPISSSIIHAKYSTVNDYEDTMPPGHACSREFRTTKIGNTALIILTRCIGK